MSKGYYNMRKNPTKAGRKDPRFVEAFNWARDMEYTVGEARVIARSVVYLMDQNSTLSVQDAIYKTLYWGEEKENEKTRKMG